MASRKRLSVWGILARVGLTGDHDDIIEHVFEMTSRVTLQSNDGEPMDGGEFLCRVFDSLGSTRDWPALGSAQWERLRLLALRKVVSRLAREGLLDCVAVTPVADSACGNDANSAKGGGTVSQAPRVTPEGVPDIADGLVERVTTDDNAPEDAVGEDALRYDAIFLNPAAVTLHGRKMTAYWPPSFGMVKLQPSGSGRSVVVMLDDLDNASRRILRETRTRLRTEAVVRCSVRNCPRCHRGWVRHDTRIEDLKGRPINEFSVLFAALCEEHREPR